MHKKIVKAASASLMAAAMLTTTVAAVAPMSVSAGSCLGESEFTTKGLPWHTCETSPAKQTFGLTDDGTYLCTIVNPGGATRGGESRWDLQFRHRKLKIQKNHTYKIHWEVTASTAGDMATQIASLDGESAVVWHNNASDFNQGWNNVQIKAGKNVFDSEFTADKDIEVAEWAFHYGGQGEWQDHDCFPAETTLEWDNMTLECTTCGDTYKEGSCLWDPTDDFGVRSRKNSGLANNFISVNQVGYFTNLAKKATLGDNAGGGVDDLHTTLPTTALDFDLIDASGNVVYSGKTQPMSGSETESGDFCHILDFSEFKTPGTYSLKCGDYVSFDFEIGDDLFSKEGHNLLTNAMNYYYQNRSGINIEEAYITSRDDIKSELAHIGGHNPDEAYVQPKWVKSYAGEFDGDTSYTIDGVGGWYDAGDHGKYVVNGGISVWTLQNIYERSVANGDASKFADGSGVVVIPEASNGAPDILDEARVEVEWMMKMVVQSKDPHWGDKAGLVYHKLHDHKWTGLATRPYDYVDTWGTTRIVKPPSFAATLNFVACAAQAARLWEDYDPAFSKECLDAAKSSYAAFEKHFYEYKDSEADNPTSLYAPMDQAIGGGAYGDTNVKDDAYWAACELFLSTGDSAYYDDMKGYEKAFEVVTKIEGGENNGSWGSFNWGNTSSLGSISLLLNEDKVEAADIEKVKSTLKSAADTYVAKTNEQGYGIPYDTAVFTDPVNIGYDDNGKLIEIDGYEWGSNSFVINNAIVMAYAYDTFDNDTTYLNGVASSMDYLLGRNPLSFSYVTGYGDYTLERPHHRYWSNELDPEFPEAPDGILSGGPGSGMQDPYIGGLGYVRGALAPQRCYVDSIEAWSVNEITINWNAPLVWVASFMQDEAGDAEYVDPTTSNTDPTDPSTDPTDPSTDPTDPSDDPTGDTANTDPDLVKKANWGDVNEDNAVDAADIVALNLYLLNAKANPVSDQGYVNANCNYDASVDSTDSALIMNYVSMVIDYSELGPQ